MARILEAHVQITNTTQSQKTITGYMTRHDGKSGTAMANPDVQRELSSIRARSPQLARHSVLDSGDTVSGWLTYAFDWDPTATGKPTYQVLVSDEHNVNFEATRQL